MFLRKTERRKNGKTHLYWSVVENQRLDNGRVVQRHLLYLGEINSVASRSLAQGDRSVRRGPRALALARPVPRGSLRSARRRRRDPAAAQRDAALPAAPIWRLLARRRSLARLAARPVLGRTPAQEPQGHALGSRAAGAGDLPPHRAGKRVAAASPMVFRQRHGRLVGLRFRPRGSSQALRLPRPAAGSQTKVVLASD